MKRIMFFLALLLSGIGAAFGQIAIGGNVSLSATASSSNVQLSASIVQYPAVFINYISPSPTVEVFYLFGNSNAVAATTSSPALPPGGICVYTGGGNNWLAAIGSAAGPTVVRVTQLTNCPGGR
jgi:hypothetical protein